MTSQTWRLTLKRRVIVVAGFLAFWVVGIEARLIFLQVISRAEFETRAERQRNRTQELPAKRGDILDRRGHVLATSVDADTVYAVPSELANPAEVVDKLCAAFRDCQKKERQALLERLNRQKQFAYVRRQIPPDAAQRVADLNLEGIGFLKESKRFYPNRELGAHMAPGAVRHFAASEEAAEVVAPAIRPGDLVLVKGSRGVRTDRVVERLKAERG